MIQSKYIDDPIGESSGSVCLVLTYSVLVWDVSQPEEGRDVQYLEFSCGTLVRQPRWSMAFEVHAALAANLLGSQARGSKRAEKLPAAVWRSSMQTIWNLDAKRQTFTNLMGGWATAMLL